MSARKNVEDSKSGHRHAHSTALFETLPGRHLYHEATHAVLYQDSRIALDAAIADPEKLVEVLRLFFDHKQPDIPDWKDAVAQFSAKIADLARGVNEILTAEHKRNPTFPENFQSFAGLCRQSINPDLADPAIQNMLVQHLLTGRIVRRVFNNNEFLRRNVIAAEIEKVIASITARQFSSDRLETDFMNMSADHPCTIDCAPIQ